MIDSFVGKWACLSNFYSSTFWVKGDKYLSVEHFMQSHKTEDEFYSRAVREAKDAWEAKKLGRMVPLRNDWNIIRPSLLWEALTEKFKNVFLMDILLQTGNEELVFKNTWNDTFSGVCRGTGQNYLGRYLMTIRDNHDKNADADP